MGKVIVNETSATKTARSGSHESSTHRESMSISGEKDHKQKETSIIVHDSKALPAGTDADQKSNDSRDRTITKFRQLPVGDVKSDGAAKTSEVAIVKVSGDGATVSEAVTKKDKPAQKKAEHKIDPELALMASRSASAERTKIDAGASSKSMSGMVRERRYASHSSARVNANGKLGHADTKAAKQSEPELRFTKAKSTLIGVGVALAVAVVGFGAIAAFGSNKRMCVVNFESNGGSDVDGEEIVCGRTVGQPSDPVKDGFNFEGWIYDGDPFDFGTEIYRNATLVAKWNAKEGTEIVTIKFDTDGGSKISDVQIAKGRTMSPPTAPKKIGYVLDDWYLGDKVFDFSTPINENITLKAHWVRSSNPAPINNNTARPANDRVTSINIGNLSIKAGENLETGIGIIPSAAVYELSANSSDSSVVSCSIINGKNLLCKAVKAGTAKVTIKDSKSGQSRVITVTVAKAEEPPVEPKPEENKPGGNESPGNDDNNTEDPGEDDNKGDKPDNPGGNGGSGDNKEDPNKPGGEEDENKEEKPNDPPKEEPGGEGEGGSGDNNEGEPTE